MPSSFPTCRSQPTRWFCRPARGVPVAVLAMLLASGVGCEGNRPEADSPADAVEPADAADAAAAAAEGAAAAGEGASAAAEGAAAQPATAPIPLKFASWQEVTAQVAAAGRPAVLDIWALSCEPCLKEFPGLVRLHQNLGDRVACFSINVEFDGRKTRPPETYREPVETFLRSVNATLPNFISSTASDEIFAAADIDSIPTVIVYAADGSIAKKFVDAGETAGFTYDKDVIPLVRRLVGDEPKSE